MKKLFTLITLLFISSLAFSQITITSTVTNVTCFGLSNGSATVTASGGSGAPYTYTLFSSPFPTNSTGIFTGLVAGTYSLSISDASANTTSTFVTITQPTQINIATTQTNVTCNGLCDAAINTITTGGTLPYVSWIWNIPTAPTLPNIINVCPGTWMVSVTDINGCTSSQNVTITQPSPLNSNVSASPACNGVCSATANINSFGGTAPYQYSWSDGSTTPQVPNLCAGTYTVQTLDANNCVVQNSVTVISYSINLAVTSTSALCNGTPTGTINITSVIGGNPAYVYNLNGGSYTASPVFNNVFAGIYTAGVRDIGGCIGTQTVLVTEPTQLNSITNVDHVKCFGTSTGTITAAGTGGIAPYTYLWPSIPSTLATVPNVAIGTYTVLVTDANGCVTGNSITVLQPTQLIATTTVTNANCGQADGSACIIATGGAPSYFYYWDIGSNATCNTNIPAGVHSYTVLDANGCIFPGNTTINNIGGPTISITSQTNVTCFGLCNGVATSSATGGTSPYIYSWSQGQVTPTASNLCAGVYTVSVSDANGCISTNSVNITQPNQVVANSVPTNITCNGACDGSYVAVAIGGTPPYYYSNNLGNTGNNVSNLCPGTYTISVTDANNCLVQIPTTITQPTQLIATISSSNANCGQANGAVCAIVSGGTSPYNYLWSFGSTTLCGNNIPAGAYTFTVIDINGCITVSTGLVNNISGPLASIASATNATCGQPDGALCAITTGGVAPYNYSWSNGATTLCNTNIPVGVYSFSVTDAAGCISSVVGQINNIGGPTVSITNQTNVTCFGLCDGSAITSVTAGTAPYTYSWSNGSTIPNATNLCAGLYSVSITDFFGCIGTASLNISQPQPLSIAITAANNTCFGTCNGTASVVAMGGTPGYAFVWNTAPSQSGQTINNICPGNWSCVVTDMNGCSGTASVNIGQTAPLITNITKTDVTCGGNCDGQAFANVSGGSGAFTFLWLPTLQTGNTANGLCAGQYSLNVTDQNGCVTTETFVIANQGVSAITNATLTTTVINETCLLTNDGGIDLTINGTNPGPFTYQWSNGATTQDITNIPTGSYNVTVFDASLNCLSISSNVNTIGTNCGTISGNVFIDNNSDCIKNSGDNNSNNTLVIANPGNRIGYTNFNGDYIFYNLPFGTYTITSSTNANMLATCVTTLNTTLNSVTPNSINNNFAKEYIPITQPDLQVSAYSNGIVPGFVCYVNYYISNLNNIPATGLFKAVLPSAFIPNITTGNPNTYSISGDTVIWNFNNITNLTGYNYFTINFTVPLSTPLGSIFTSCMWAQPNIADLNYANNTYCYHRLVTGSFDPNDKTVSPVGIGTTGDIAASVTDLTYLIRFQNTGNGPAVNIVVKDTLSSNVDVNTFEMLGSSHNYNIDILPGNILRWKFNNIMLPDSNSNEPASHGYIQYRIKRNSNNTPGTQIKNIAYIYFDFNEPVVTNTAINTIETITGIKSNFNSNEEWNVYPNPSTGVLYIVNSSSVKEATQIQVINSIGQTVLEENITSNYKNIDLSKLNNGVYFVKITSDKQSVIKRVVLSK